MRARLPAILEQEGIDDRAVDLWSPLIALATVADAEDCGIRTRHLLDLARDVGTVRDADAEAGTTARLLEALEVIRAELGETPAPSELLEALRARPGWDWMKTTRRLAGLRARYGGAVDASEEPDGTTPSTFSGSNPVTSGASGDNPHK